MSNSPLVNYTKISPHRNSPRNHKIDTITIHCVVGQCAVEPLGELFQTKEASSNYGIGYDGKIGMYVEEKDRSWCSSDADNDNRAITIECASDTTEPYAINDKVYKSLINLCVDICRRNGIKELKWKADKSLIGHPDKQNMTVHRWFNPAKSCPGTYIYSRLGKIAAEVNSRLGVTHNTKPDGSIHKKTIADIAAEVIRGEWGNGIERKTKILAAGYDYDKVQSEVDKIIGNSIKPIKTKSISEIASEVVKGLWGNGVIRKERLSEAGYDYDKVQSEVDKIVTASKTNAKKSITEIANEVIRGEWGNGSERKKKLTAAGYDYDEVQKKVNFLICK